jgi:hypothetical protein
MSLLEPLIVPAIAKKGKVDPIFFVHDDYIYSVVRDASEKDGYYVEFGRPFFLERMESVLGINKKILNEYQAELNRYKSEYSAQISTQPWTKIDGAAQIAREIKFFVDECVPAYKGSLNSVKSFSEAQFAKHISHHTYSNQNNSLAIINGRIFDLERNSRGSICIDDCLYVRGAHKMTLDSHTLSYRKNLAQSLRDEVDNSLNYIHYLSKVDLSDVDVFGSRYEHADVGYDANLRLVYYYLDPDTRIKWTHYGAREVAVGACIQDSRLGVGGLQILVKDSSGNLVKKPTPICTGHIYSVGEGVSKDISHLKRAGSNFSRSGRFHENH